ncbi:MAG: 16S rRNA (guanine(966)-N(2))-methyltransferase RsmD [Eubacteriales bacterium]
MRIITGSLKGRRLESPKNDKIRPTSDKVKEAIFSMLFDEFYDMPVCDLFAGTGNLGLEAISRGASCCYFADSSRESVALLKRNIEYCNVGEQAIILAGDYAQALHRIRGKMAVIFLDPPYEAGYMQDALKLIDSLDILEKNGCIVAEHSRFEKLEDTIGRYEKIKEKVYGKIVISIFKNL